MKTLAFLLLILPCIGLAAQCCDLARPDAHAPLAVMGDHLHPKGQLMLGAHAHLMNMRMAGHHQGGVGSSTMQMYMLEGMYGVGQRTTFMLTLPYLLTNSRAGTAQVATDTRTISGGMGDISLSALVGLRRTKHTATHLNVGVSIPTGSINRTERTTYGTLKMPYMMQAGSGSLDALLALTHWYQQPRWSGGWQLSSTLRTANNKNGYRLGNHAVLNGWLAYRWGEQVSTSVRAEWHYQSPMYGSDPAIDPDTRIPQGQHIGLAVGVHYYLLGAAGRSNRLATEIYYPAYYTPQLGQQRTNWEAQVGWQKTYQLRAPIEP